MSWTLQWSFVVEHRDLLEIHWQVAARICAALMQLAETGRGDLAQIEADDPNRFRLRVKGAEARLFVDTKARTIYVVRIFPRG
jgi:hypothetical protein